MGRDIFYLRAWVWRDQAREYEPDRIAEFETYEEANAELRTLRLTPDIPCVELCHARVNKHACEEGDELLGRRELYGN